MPDQSFKCVKCENKMEKGFIVDQSEDHRRGVIYHAYWVAGAPVEHTSVITGGNLGHLNITDRNIFRVFALRCENCGYLESYAI